MYSDKTGMDKNHPRTKPSRQKDPLTKPPDKNPCEQLKQNLYKEAFVRDFCTRPSRNQGRGPRCVTYFRGVPGMCDEGEEG